MPYRGVCDSHGPLLFVRRRGAARAWPCCRPLGERPTACPRIELGEEPPTRETCAGFRRDMRRLRALLGLVVARPAD